MAGRKEKAETRRDLPTSGPGVVHETSAHNVPEGGAAHEYGQVEGQHGTHVVTAPEDDEK